jgi:parallel beta-helix repeat protein
MKNLARCFFFFSLAFFVSAGAAHAAVFYVKTTGNDANSGLSWVLAKRTVQAAVNAANQGDEIWVAAGTYAEHIRNKTTGPSGSEVAVDTALYGGFAGTETARDQRNWTTNVTTLDGGGSTGTTVNGSVVIIDAGATQATRIDGFVITRGHGIAAGGIYIGGSAPVIANNTITQNFSNVGGGILISNYKITPPQAHPVITNNTIVYNYATEVGGGIVVVGSERLAPTYDPVTPAISRNNISRNVSAFHAGGIGIFGHSAPQVFNNYIFGNIAAYSEATFMGNGGGIYATSRDVDDAPLRFTVCAPVIANNVIAANGANFGGGIHLWDTDVEHGGIPQVTNNTVFGNNGTGISWITTNPILQNNLVAYNSRGLEQGASADVPQALRNNCVYGNELWEANTDYNGLADQTGINGNIAVDPKMANYKIGNFRLQTGSPLIDAGDSAAVGGGWTDFDGQARIIGGAVDIGADEADGTVGPAATPIYYVRTGGNDTQDGLSWATAKRTVVGTIAAAQSTGGEIWAAAGTYTERIILPAFLYLYGGFAGTETSRAQRNITANPSILDGGGGQPTVVNSLYAGYFLSAVDGFTIQNGGIYTGGAYPGTTGYGGRGAGIYCQVTSPLIQNNTIRHNSLGNPFDSPNRTGYGAGIYTYLSYALIKDNLITENEILNNNADTGSGGGIYFFRSMPTITGNTISNNRAISGAAIYGKIANPRIIGNIIEGNAFYTGLPGYYMGANQGAVTLAMCWDFLIERNRIKGNIAAATGAMGAGISVSTAFAGRIQSNLILDNSATGIGGGIYAQVPLEATSSLYIVNNTIAGNTGAYAGIQQGGGIAVSIPPPIFTPPDPIPNRVIVANNIIAFNSSGLFETLTNPMVYPTLVKNDVYENGSNNYIYIPPGATDLHVDPLFVNRAGGNYHLQAASLCIEAGDNAILPASLVADYDGRPRVIDGNANRAAVVDIGAYEYPAPTNVSGLFDYGGTAATDVAAFHAATNQFFTLADGNLGQYGWGFPGDCYPLVWDYSQNGKTDISIYHIPTNQWFVRGVPGDNLGQYGFGLDDSVPVPGDYNGDGIIERAFYHWPTNRWFIEGQADPIQFGFGGADCVPFVGDYDGDGKTDMMLYHIPSNQWFVHGIGNIGQFGWGGADCLPVPGDWNGDGKTEIAVYYVPDNEWIWRDANGTPHFMGRYGWGGEESFPIPGDYNDDGAMERGFYRYGQNWWFTEGQADFFWGWGGRDFLPITSQTAVYNWFRFALNRFQ